ncbi:hypothetical protein LCGC14_2441720, partial [marine sediment metagenome]
MRFAIQGKAPVTTFGSLPSGARGSGPIPGQIAAQSVKRTGGLGALSPLGRGLRDVLGSASEIPALAPWG